MGVVLCYGVASVGLESAQLHLLVSGKVLQRTATSLNSIFNRLRTVILEQIMNRFTSCMMESMLILSMSPNSGLLHSLSMWSID